MIRIVYTLALVTLFFKQLFQGYAKDSWQITEWLINYQGGFVRRGLWGEIFWKLNQFFWINPYPIIILICLLIYLLLILFFIRAFYKRRYSFEILSSVFFLGSPIIGDFWVRKDSLISLIFILILNLSIRKIKWQYFWINFLFTIGILTHESLGFIGLPMIFLITWNQNSLVSFFKLTPALAVFLICLYFKGSVMTATAIWNSWRLIPFPIPAKSESQLPTAIEGISLTLKEGVSITTETLTGFNSGIYAPLAWLIVFLAIYYLLTKLSKNLGKILVFQFLAISPLLVLGADYNRWIFLWVSTALSIFLIVPERFLNHSLPNFITLLNIFIDKSLKKFFQHPEIPLLMLIGIPVTSWSLHTYFGTTPIGVILDFIKDCLNF
jgi:hypothetical protein